MNYAVLMQCKFFTRNMAYKSKSKVVTVTQIRDDGMMMNQTKNKRVKGGYPL